MYHRSRFYIGHGDEPPRGPNKPFPISLSTLWREREGTQYLILNQHQELIGNASRKLVYIKQR